MTQRENKRALNEVYCRKHFEKALHTWHHQMSATVSWYYLCQPFFKFPFTWKYHGTSMWKSFTVMVYTKIYGIPSLSWHSQSTIWIGFGMQVETKYLYKIFWKEGGKENKKVNRKKGIGKIQEKERKIYKMSYVIWSYIAENIAFASKHCYCFTWSISNPNYDLRETIKTKGRLTGHAHIWLCTISLKGKRIV